MPIEIERKFLVTNDSWRAAAHEVVPMAQGYINDQAAMDGGAQRASVRVRIAGAEAFLNIKSREAGHTRQEFDYPIPVEDGRALLALCVGGLIDKRRHYVDHAGHLWEVDEFFGDKDGLGVGGGVVYARHRPSVAHGVPLGEGGEFCRDIAGLVVAECELDAAESRCGHPPGLGPDFTDAGRYYNLALASHPFTRW